MRKGHINQTEELTSLESDECKSTKDIELSLCNQYISGIKSDNKLKVKYATILIIILCAQLIIINGIFIFVGLGILNYTQFTINLYVSACVLEVTALVTIIVKYLFSSKNSRVDDMVRDYIKKDELKNYYDFIPKG